MLSNCFNEAVEECLLIVSASGLLLDTPLPFFPQILDISPSL